MLQENVDGILQKDLSYVPEINCTKRISLKSTRTSEIVESSRYFPPIAVGPRHHKEEMGASSEVLAGV